MVTTFILSHFFNLGVVLANPSGGLPPSQLGFSVISVPSVAPTTAPSPRATPATTGDADADALMEAREKNAKSLDALSAIALPENDKLPDLSALQDPRLKKAAELLNQPIIQKYLSLFTSPDIQNAAQLLVQHPNRSTYFYAVGALLLFTWVLKAWLSARSKSVASRLAITFGVTALFWALSTLIIPWAIFGDPWIKIIQAIWNVF